MENEIYQILKKHKLPLKKREEVLTDLLLLFNVSGSLHLLNEMYEELRLKEKEGFETWQDRDINSNHQNAILLVRRLIQKRAAK